MLGRVVRLPSVGGDNDEAVSYGQAAKSKAALICARSW
jgi:hypothetical protein